MSVSRIRVGVVGGGSIAKAHVIAVRSLRSYFGGDGRDPEVVAIADVDPEAAEQAALAYGVDRWTADWMALVEDEQIDMITIAVPNDQHETVAVAAAKAGKHVMSEKPLANTVEAGRRMLAAVQEAGVVHSVNLNYRSIPAIRYAPSSRTGASTPRSRVRGSSRRPGQEGARCSAWAVISSTSPTSWSGTSPRWWPPPAP
jgi:predicted dehydrogenase